MTKWPCRGEIRWKPRHNTLAALTCGEPVSAGAGPGPLWVTSAARLPDTVSGAIGADWTDRSHATLPVPRAGQRQYAGAPGGHRPEPQTPVGGDKTRASPCGLKAHCRAASPVLAPPNRAQSAGQREFCNTLGGSCGPLLLASNSELQVCGWLQYQRRIALLRRSTGVEAAGEQLADWFALVLDCMRDVDTLRASHNSPWRGRSETLIVLRAKRHPPEEGYIAGHW